MASELTALFNKSVKRHRRLLSTTRVAGLVPPLNYISQFKSLSYSKLVVNLLSPRPASNSRLIPRHTSSEITELSEKHYAHPLSTHTKHQIHSLKQTHLRHRINVRVHVQCGHQVPPRGAQRGRRQRRRGGCHVSVVRGPHRASAPDSR